MPQISRPIQIALAAVVVLLGVWLIALRGHSAGSASSSSATSAAATTPTAAPPSTGGASASQSAPGGGTPASKAGVYHGSAPGVAGLTRAIEKARGAVKTSEHNAQQLQRKAAQASSASSQQSDAAAASNASSQPSGPAHSSSAAASTPTAPKSIRSSAPTKQPLVEGELEHGRTVIVLFWNPKASVDVAVRGQLSLLHAFMRHTAILPQNRDVAVHYSPPGEVGAYGAITRSLQVLQTPTLLVIAPSGKTKTLTGFVDAYAIRQAIKEARLR